MSGLREESVAAGSSALVDRLLAALPSEHDDRDRMAWVELPDGRCRLDAVYAWEIQVHEDHVRELLEPGGGVELLQSGEGVLGGITGRYLAAKLL